MGKKSWLYGLEDLTLLKWQHSLIYRLGIISVRILVGYFVGIDRLILKWIRKLKKHKIAWTITVETHTFWFQNLLQSDSN